MTDSPKPQTASARTFNLNFDHGACDVELTSDAAWIGNTESIPVIEASALDELKAENADLKRMLEIPRVPTIENFLRLQKERDQLRKERDELEDDAKVYKREWESAVERDQYARAELSQGKQLLEADNKRIRELEAELANLEIKYKERGLAMQDTADQVRGLYEDKLAKAQAEVEFLTKQREVFIRTRQESINEQDSEVAKLQAQLKSARIVIEFYAKHHHHLKTTSPNFGQKWLKENP